MNKIPIFYILAYKNQKRVDRLVESIGRFYPDNSIVICDNSKEGPYILAPNKYCHVINGPDGGFTPGFNECLKHYLDNHYKGPDSQVIPIIMNDDLEIEEGFVEGLLGVFDRHPNAGIVAPMQVTMDNPAIVICGGFGAAYPGGQHATGMRGDKGFKEREYKWVTFCCVAIHPNAIQKLGFLNPFMAMYFSDSDYCIRGRIYGIESWFTPEAVVRHENHGATGEFHTERKRNRHLLMDQWMFEYVHGPGILEYLSHS